MELMKISCYPCVSLNFLIYGKLIEEAINFKNKCILNFLGSDIDSKMA